MKFHPLTQAGQGTLARPMVSLAVAHDLLELRRQHRTDRSIFFGGEDASLAQEVGVQFQSDVRFHIARITVQHYFTCSLGLASSNLWTTAWLTN